MLGARLIHQGFRGKDFGWFSFGEGGGVREGFGGFRGSGIGV